MIAGEIETPRGLKSWICSGCGSSNRYQTTLKTKRLHCLVCKLYIDSKTEKVQTKNYYEIKKRARENRQKVWKII
jgi:hypothetical protein